MTYFCACCGEPSNKPHKSDCPYQGKETSYYTTEPKEVSKVQNYGWICPKCGRGNSPYTSTCPCIPFEYKVTCGG